MLSALPPLPIKLGTLVWDPRRPRFAAAGPSDVVVADVTTGAVSVVSPGPGEPIGISPRDDVVAIRREVRRGYEVSFREISSGIERFRLQSEEDVDEVRWSADGRWVACFGSDVTVRDAVTGSVHFRYRETEDVRDFWIEDGKYVERTALDARLTTPAAVWWSPDSEHLVVLFQSRRIGVHHHVSVLRASDGALVAQAPANYSGHIAWSEWGETVVEVGSARLGARPEIGKWGRPAFSPDGRCVAVEEWPALELLRGSERSLVRLSFLSEQRTSIYELAWSSKGILAISCGDGLIFLMDETDAITELARIPPVRSLSWSPDGTLLAASGPLSGRNATVLVLSLA